MRAGDNEPEIAVPVLEIRLGVQGDIPAIDTSSLQGEIHHPAADMQTPMGSIDGQSSNNDVVCVIKNTQRADWTTADRRPHQDRRRFEFTPVQIWLSTLLLPIEHGAAQPQALVKGGRIHAHGGCAMKVYSARLKVCPDRLAAISPHRRRHHAPHLDRMSYMSTPRRAAPDDDTDLADVTRSWRRYLILVICGVIVAVLGLGIFGYLAWWSLCDQAAGVCQRGEPVMYWCSVVALAILGLIIGVLTQIWLEKRWWHVLAIVIPAVFITAGIFFWLAV